MNWKHEAVEMLQKLSAMRQATHSIPLELQRLEMEAEGIRGLAMEDIKVAGTGKREDALLSNLMHRQELQNAYHQADSWVTTVEGALEVLTPEERLVLERLYIYPRKRGVEELCDQLQMEKSSVYRKRDRALRIFTMAMYGAEGG